MRRDPEKAALALPTFIRCGAALALGFPLVCALAAFDEDPVWKYERFG